MNINDLISIVKKKLESNFPGKYHLKLKISSKELNKISRIESNKKIFKILKNELAEYIHSIQILIN